MWCIHMFAEGCTTSLKRLDVSSRGSAMEAAAAAKGDLALGHPHGRFADRVHGLLYRAVDRETSGKLVKQILRGCRYIAHGPSVDPRDAHRPVSSASTAIDHLAGTPEDSREEQPIGVQQPVHTDRDGLWRHESRRNRRTSAERSPNVFDGSMGVLSLRVSVVARAFAERHNAASNSDSSVNRRRAAGRGAV